jgi:hypothetical protein
MECIKVDINWGGGTQTEKTGDVTVYKKFMQELIAYFPFILLGPLRIRKKLRGLRKTYTAEQCHKPHNKN